MGSIDMEQKWAFMYLHVEKNWLSLYEVFMANKNIAKEKKRGFIYIDHCMYYAFSSMPREY